MDVTGKIISNCPICKSSIKNAYSLPFEDIIGMAHEYTQMIGFCKKCGFIFTQNPFSAKKS